MLKLIIIRHGNTFDKGDPVLRVGLRTDLPLSNSGIAQAQSLAQTLPRYYPDIDRIYCSELQRTRQTAEAICDNYPALLDSNIETLNMLNEIDYGVDDGQPDQMVVDRHGQGAIDDWDRFAILLNVWLFDVANIKQQITAFCSQLANEADNQTIALVTSNGVARFFLKVLTDLKDPVTQPTLKMPTASVSELRYDPTKLWQCTFWGKRF